MKQGRPLICGEVTDTVTVYAARLCVSHRSHVLSVHLVVCYRFLSGTLRLFSYGATVRGAEILAAVVGTPQFVQLKGSLALAISTHTEVAKVEVLHHLKGRIAGVTKQLQGRLSYWTMIPHYGFVVADAVFAAHFDRIVQAAQHVRRGLKDKFTFHR